MGSLRQVDVPQCRATAQASEIAVFDFLSHEHMHLAFNEGYLRILRAAYPNDHISFRAVKGHVERLAPRVADLGKITFQPCTPFETSFGLSHHNPIAGRWAARHCLNVMTQGTAGRSVRFTALLGFNANLLVVIGHGWPAVSPTPLHMILHGQLGEAMVWRSRNPFIRAGDLMSQLKRPLPRSVQIVALELGVKEAIVAISPAVTQSIVTLEHPILVSEWAENSRTLARKPSKTPLPRQEYLEALGEVDLVCLPLHSRAYDFTASGTVSDAIAALKPLIAFRTHTLEAISAHYGRIGWLVDNNDTLVELVRTLDHVGFARQRSGWIHNLKAIREARSPQMLASTYSAAIAGINTPAAGSTSPDRRHPRPVV